MWYILYIYYIVPCVITRILCDIQYKYLNLNLNLNYDIVWHPFDVWYLGYCVICHMKYDIIKVSSIRCLRPCSCQHLTLFLTCLLDGWNYSDKILCDILYDLWYLGYYVISDMMYDIYDIVWYLIWSMISRILGDILYDIWYLGYYGIVPTSELRLCWYH